MWSWSQHEIYKEEEHDSAKYIFNSNSWLYSLSPHNWFRPLVVPRSTSINIYTPHLEVNLTISQFVSHLIRSLISLAFVKSNLYSAYSLRHSSSLRRFHQPEMWFSLNWYCGLARLTVVVTGSSFSSMLQMHRTYGPSVVSSDQKDNGVVCDPNSLSSLSRANANDCQVYRCYCR